MDKVLDPWLAQWVENLEVELTGDAFVLFESSLQLSASSRLAWRRADLSLEVASGLTGRRHELQIWWKAESLVDRILCSMSVRE